jgi:PBSX family phage terminase large subunit
VRLAQLGGKQLGSVKLATARQCVWEGSVRSSKTISSLVAWVRLTRQGPRGNLLMTGKTERTLKRNIIDPLTEMLGKRRCAYNQGAGELMLCGRRVYVAGANDERAQEKIKGLTLCGAYADEISTMPESYYRMLLTRLSEEGAQLFGTTNPEGPAHWLKTEFLDKAAVWLDHDGQLIRTERGPDVLDLARFSFRLEDNPHLPPAYVESLWQEFTGLWRKRLIEGLWVVAEGAVYDMFDTERHVVDELPVIKRYICASVDYGVTNPFHALLIGLGADRRLYVVSEWRWDSRARRRQLTDVEYSAKLSEWLASVRHPGSALYGVTPERIVVDPSAASFRVQLFRDRRQPVAADNEVLDGIRCVASLLGTGRLKIHRSCTHLISEMQGYSWDEKAAARGEDAPIKKDDHGPDTLRYGLFSTRSVWRNLILPPEPPPNYQDHFGVPM